MSVSQRAVKILVQRLREAARAEIDLDCHCDGCRQATEPEWREVEVEAILALAEKEHDTP